VNRSQAVIIAILVGFVALVFMGMIVLLLFPYERVFPPTPTATIPPTITPTPTFQEFLPTPAPATPSVEPTATNTLVPTVTPSAPKDSTPTVVIELPAPQVRPTATPTSLPTVTPGPTTAPFQPTSTPIPRQFSVSFEADEPTIEKGECTDLEWEVQGASDIRLDGRPVGPSGDREVCPTRETTYRLSYQLPGSAAIQSTTITIKVEDKE